jgi:hypothetical protein
MIKYIAKEEAMKHGSPITVEVDSKNLFFKINIIK